MPPLRPFLFRIAHNTAIDVLRRHDRKLVELYAEVPEEVTVDEHVDPEIVRVLLEKHGDWMLLGSADEQKPAAPDTVEAWGRSGANPVKGWYGLKKGLRGRFGMYVPPVLEALGLAEVEHNPKNNRMRRL